MNTLYLELVLYLNLGYWTWFTVYLMLNLSPSENVSLDLLYCTCYWLSCILWGFFSFALFSVILVCSDRNISLDFTEYDACWKSMKDCDFGPFTGEIHLWEVQMEVSWRVSGTCLSLAVLKTESKLVQCMYFSSISISRRLVMLLPSTWHLRVLHILYILLCTLPMLMMKCRV